MWSTPLQIPLDTAHKTVVGRLPSKVAGVHHVFLNSEKLPFMLSKQHASLAYDKAMRRWLIEDMKSQNGVYVNGTRIKEAMTLSDTDKICFGCRVPKNELKYVFCWKYGKAWLTRNSEPFVSNLSPQNLASSSSSKSYPAGSTRDRIDSSESDGTPPLERMPKRSITQHPSGRKKLRLDHDESNQLTPTQPITSSGSSSMPTHTVANYTHLSPTPLATSDVTLTPATCPNTSSHSLSPPFFVSSPQPISSPRSQVLPQTFSPHNSEVSYHSFSSTSKTKPSSPQAVPSSPMKQCGRVSTSLTNKSSTISLPKPFDLTTAPYSCSSPNIQAHGHHTIPVPEVCSNSSTISTGHVTFPTVSAPQTSSPQTSSPQTSSPLHTVTVPASCTHPALPITLAYVVKSSQPPGSPQVNVTNNPMLSPALPQVNVTNNPMLSLASSQTSGATGVSYSHVNFSMGQPSHVLPASSSVQSSPALSVAPTKSAEVNDLFDDIHSKSDDRLLDDVIITGYDSPVKQCSAPIVLSDTPISSTKALRTNTSRVSAKKSRATSSSIAAEHSSPLVALSGVKPSPALSVASTKSVEVDDLFDNIVSMSDDNLLDEAVLFGDNSVPDASSALTNTAMDGATIQVLAAQQKQQQEKHKLLSSIEALKSELAAKNELITKIEQDNKDEATVCSIREEFTCVICQELFISAHTLPCAHSFCEYCIKEWTKKKYRKECPICRKRITSEPVHSLVLDNAIEKIEVKLSVEDKQERDEVKAEHKKQLGVAKPAS